MAVADTEMTETELKRRYRWQCRRGLLEVDLVLNEYLDRMIDTETEQQQRLFGQLLAEQDTDLFEWFTGRSVPRDTELKACVEQILARLARPD